VSIATILPWLLILPLCGAIVSLIIPERFRAALSLPLILSLVLVSAQLLQALINEGRVTYALGDWPAPLGIPLIIDGFAVGMILLTTLISAMCALYAWRYLRDDAAANAYFWPLFWFLWASLNVIWLSGDLFNLYVGLELLTLAAVGLVALRGNDEALAASMRYLLLALLGSLAYLLGVALMYGAYGTLAINDIAVVAEAQATTWVALALMSIGLLLKTALFPLHAWLPPAHGGALTPVSALLSALVIKASLFILIRLWLALGPDIATPPAATLLGLLGAGAVFWGGWMAWRQEKLKYLVAYSTVAQIGYLFLFFPLFTGTSEEAARLAWDGTLLMLISHALAKAGMFLSAGNLILAVGGDKVDDLVGINRLRLTSLVSFGIAGVSLMGLPPSGGFTAKWLLLQSSLSSGQWWWLIVLLGGSVLSAAYVFRVFHRAYLDGEVHENMRTPPRMLEVSAMLLAVGSIFIGLAAYAPLEWLRIGSGLGGGA